MSNKDLIIGVVLLQIIFGILGNISLLSHIIGFTKYRLRAIGLILKSLTIANSLDLLSKGIPQKMAAFRYFIYQLNVWSSFLLCLFYINFLKQCINLTNFCILYTQDILLFWTSNCWHILKWNHSVNLLISLISTLKI